MRGWVAIGLVAGLLSGRAAAAPRPLPAVPPLTAHDRLLVIAPHCDDETLASGGLIQQAVAVHAPVQVVILTNGDGFRSAAQAAFGTEQVTPQQFLSLGLRRQRESLAGLARLGLSGRQVTFLGYPDGGLVRLWVQYWERTTPYTSTATQEHANPYPLSLHPHAPYAGRAVVDDLKSVVRRFHPTVVTMPHPGDRHPDHWTAYGYGNAALYELGELGSVRVLYYLVHRRGWSEPPDPKAARVLDPPDAVDTWHALALTREERARQQAAVNCYRSQLAVLRDFMVQFLGRRALFASIPPGKLPAVSPPSGEGEAAKWAHLEPAVPAGNVPGTRFGPIWVSASGTQLNLRVHLTAPVDPAVSYRVYVHPLTRDRVEPPREYVLDPSHPSKGVTVRGAGHVLEAELPWHAEYTGVMLAAEARVKGALPDRTRWVTLLAERPPSVAAARPHRRSHRAL